MRHRERSRQEPSPKKEPTLAPGKRRRSASRAKTRWLHLGGVLAVSSAAGAALVITLVAVKPQVVAYRAVFSEVSPKRSLAQQRWFRGKVNVAVDASLSKVTPEAPDVVARTFETWRASGAKLPAVHLEHAQGLKPSLEPDGINAVMFAPIDLPGHEHDLAVTIGFSNPETGEITEADIIVNSRHRYSVLNSDPQISVGSTSCNGAVGGSKCGSLYDLQNVLTHEVGHFYGLGEDPKNRSATMFSCTSACETHKRELEVSDQNALLSLYLDSRASVRSSACSKPQLPRDREAWALWSGLCLSSLIAIGLRWRTRRGSRRRA